MTRASLCLVPLLCACAAPPLPPSPPTPPTATPASAPPPVPGLVDDAPAPPAAPAEMLPVESFSPPAGRFDRIPLPTGTAPIVALAGRSESDVWMVAKDGAVLHWDGARVASAGSPECYTDACCGTLFDCSKHKAMCTREASDKCQSFGPTCAKIVEWSFVELSPTEVEIGGFQETGGMRSSLVKARLDRGGSWSCGQGKDDFVYPGQRGRGDLPHAQELTLDGSSIRFEGPAVLVNAYGGHSLVIDGRRVPLPAEVGPRTQTRDAGFAARTPTDLWLWRPEDGLLWRGNGLAWKPVRVGLATVADVWLDEPGTAWVLGAEDDKEGNERLVRWDIDKGSGQRFATPGATSARKGKGGAFWLVGKRAVYGRDGRDLRRADAPTEIADAWRSPAGALWVAGSEGQRGAAFRVPALGGQKP